MTIENKLLLNLSGETADVIVPNVDPMKSVIKCPNCGQLTEYGQTRMISGYVGCDHKYLNGICYWDDLMPRVIEAQKAYGTKAYDDYVQGKLYSSLEHREEE